MSKPSGLLPSMCPEKGAFVLHTTNVRFPAAPLPLISAVTTDFSPHIFQTEQF
jgi:hypothetical protein